jgi:hypothetical protein
MRRAAASDEAEYRKPAHREEPALMSWDREFDEPIATPDGARLTTLREAVAYLASTVPKGERDKRRPRPPK